MAACSRLIHGKKIRKIRSTICVDARHASRQRGPCTARTTGIKIPAATAGLAYHSVDQEV